jgi:hypothetical protein
VSYRLELRPQVSEDIGSAVAWYDARQGGLGARFALAVRDRIDELLPNRSIPGKELPNAHAPDSMRFVVKKHRLVEDDQLTAAAWDDDQQPGLGDDFLDE